MFSTVNRATDAKLQLQWKVRKIVRKVPNAGVVRAPRHAADEPHCHCEALNRCHACLPQKRAEKMLTVPTC